MTPLASSPTSGGPKPPQAAAVALLFALALLLFLWNCGRIGRGASRARSFAKKRGPAEIAHDGGRDNLFLTFSSADRVPAETFARFANAAEPYFRLRFFDDEGCVRALQAWDGVFRGAADHFQRLTSGAHKADLFRYCALFVLGGAYLDIDVVPLVPLHKIFEVPITRLQTCAAYNRALTFQAVLAAPAGHSVMRNCAEDVLAAPFDAEDFGFVEFLREELERFVGDAPLRIGDGAYVDLRLLREECDPPCRVYDREGTLLARSKDDKYPWR
jgi:hypothetical protein